MPAQPKRNQAAARAGLDHLRTLQEAGQLAEAEAGYRDLLARNPDHADAWHLYGVIAFQQGRYKLAVDRISRSLQIRPDFAPALSNLGNVMMAIDQFGEAEKLFRMALRINPDYPDGVGNLGVLLHLLERNEEAAPLLERACRLKPDHAMFQNNLGNVLTQIDRHEEALAAYRRAVELQPDNPGFLAGMGSAHQQIGEHDAATDCFRQALEHDPHCTKALSGLTGSRKIRPGDPEIELFFQAFSRIEQMRHREKVDFLFAWGKLNDDIGEYEPAFACLAKANELRRQTRGYSRAVQENRLTQIREVFSEQRFGAIGAFGSKSERPVFILGMPRSGTTLTEQVLASHPQVAGAGELKEISRAVDAYLISQVNGRKFLDPARLSRDYLCPAAEQYLNRLPESSLEVTRVTDKMPANFWHIGHIALMFPNAAIIHVRRNPMDTLLSCFQQNFSQGQAFSNNLESAAHYYWLYRQVMGHWQSLLGHRILNVDYEELVEDPETQSRQLAEHVGLDWHEAMLAPHKTRRSIRTASQWQVRQPIHKGSVARWKRYEKQLQPLLEALQGYGIEV